MISHDTRHLIRKSWRYLYALPRMYRLAHHDFTHSVDAALSAPPSLSFLSLLCRFTFTFHLTCPACASSSSWMTYQLPKPSCLGLGIAPSFSPARFTNVLPPATYPCSIFLSSFAATLCSARFCSIAAASHPSSSLHDQHHHTFGTITSSVPPPHAQYHQTPSTITHSASGSDTQPTCPGNYRQQIASPPSGSLETTQPLQTRIKQVASTFLTRRIPPSMTPAFRMDVTIVVRTATTRPNAPTLPSNVPSRVLATTAVLKAIVQSHVPSLVKVVSSPSTAPKSRRLIPLMHGSA